MRIISWNDHSDLAQHTAEVAALIAERLGDSVQLLEGGEDHDAATTTAARSAPGAEHAHAGDHGKTERESAGTLTAVMESTRVQGVLEECIKTAASPAHVRLVLAPWSNNGASHVWPRANPALQIALHAPVATLVVRDAVPLAAWARDQHPLRVLCAHDLTTAADDALGFVKQLGQVASCSVVVVHVHHPLEPGARLGIPTHPAADCGVEIQQILERNLQDRVQRILGEIPAEIRVWPTTLRRDSAILELIRQEPADLVVAGTHQRHGLDRLSHPQSVSRALLRFAPTNVLLVPTARALPLRPRGAMSRVLVATDLTWSSNQAVPHAYALLPHGGTLRLLHVVHPLALPAGEFDEGIARSASRARHKSVLHDCEEQLRALTLAEADAPGIVTEVEVVEHREPAIAIAQAAERFGADVVCLAAHEPDSVFGRIFKSQIRTVMANTSRPVLIVHPPSP